MCDVITPKVAWWHHVERCETSSSRDNIAGWCNAITSSRLTWRHAMSSLSDDVTWRIHFKCILQHQKNLDVQYCHHMKAVWHHIHTFGVNIQLSVANMGGSQKRSRHNLFIWLANCSEQKAGLVDYSSILLLSLLFRYYAQKPEINYYEQITMSRPVMSPGAVFWTGCPLHRNFQVLRFFNVFSDCFCWN